MTPPPNAKPGLMTGVMPTFQPKQKGHAMTAAERQRRCRANGKGRHRGYRPTRADRDRMRAALRADLARAEYLETVEAAAAAGAIPGSIPVPALLVADTIVAVPAVEPVVTCAVALAPSFEWNVSAMAA